MERLMIQIPKPLKRRLDALRAQGYTAAGFIRSLLERELNRERVKNIRVELGIGAEFHPNVLSRLV